MSTNEELVREAAAAVAREEAIQRNVRTIREMGMCNDLREALIDVREVERQVRTGEKTLKEALG